MSKTEIAIRRYVIPAPLGAISTVLLAAALLVTLSVDQFTPSWLHTINYNPRKGLSSKIPK